MDTFNHIVFLTVIAGRKQQNELMAAISQNGGKLVNICYGKGSVKANYLMDAFGFVPEENKVVIICLLAKRRTDKMFRMLNEQFHFNQPNTGIAFTSPVRELSF